jgi:hypothetical protein
MRLNTEDRLALGIVVIYALFCLGMLWVKFRELTESEPAPDSTISRREALDRLEQGETMRVERWHGHDLELSGELIVDAEKLRDQEDDADAE